MLADEPRGKMHKLSFPILAATRSKTWQTNQSNPRSRRKKQSPADRLVTGGKKDKAELTEDELNRISSLSFDGTYRPKDKRQLGTAKFGFVRKGNYVEDGRRI
jgi:hypothetical protein